MKYPKALRPQLLEDVRHIIAHIAQTTGHPQAYVLRNAPYSMIIAQINAHRSYPDDHPRWGYAPRVLAPTHVTSQSWLTLLYAEHDLHDDHLHTAIKWAVTTLTQEQSA